MGSVRVDVPAVDTMNAARLIRFVTTALLLVLVVSLWSLRDPAWIGEYTHGLRPPETDGTGRVFQWTGGSAAFYVPTGNPFVEVELSSPAAAGTRVWLAIDGIPADARQVGAAWQTVRLPLAAPTSRRFRRIDIRVAQGWGDDRLGVRVARAASTRSTRE